MDLRLFDPLAMPDRLDAVAAKPLFALTAKLWAVVTLTGFLLSAHVAQADPKPTVPDIRAGTLLIVGGGKLPEMIRRHFVELAGGKNARIVLIPTASNKADQPAQLQTYLLFKSLDVKSVELFHTRDRKKADDPTFIKPLTEATGVWLSGGDQSLLSAVYHGTAVERELLKVVARGGVIGGTSAGAAVMSSLMIVGGTMEAEVGTGFGLISGVVIDQHFQNRNRMHRLLSVLAKHPECPGVGIDEETALVVTGRTATVEGNGSVWACLSPRGALAASVQVLKNGEKLDLASLIGAARARSKSTSDNKPGTPNERASVTTKP